MKLYQIQIIQTLAVIVSLALVKFIIRNVINRLVNTFHFALERKRITSKIINFFIIIVAFVLVTAIWGVKSHQVTIFLTSTLTVLGIGFFAQWSILSNISASLILFFNHPIKIGGKIRLLDKDYPIEGIVENISLFFLYIRTEDGALVSIPNTALLYKTIAFDFVD